ncbi:MAG: transporter substrate-binding domain-containing protein [Saccharospirillum sp.]
MKLPVLLAIVVLLVAAGAGGAWYYSSSSVPEIDLERVRIGVDIPYPPYSYRDSNGELTGFEIDLGNAVCARLQVECEWVIVDWDNIIPGLLDNQYDAIMSSMTVTAERRNVVDFGQPYYSTPSVMFVRNDSGIDSDSRSALADRRIGVIGGTTQHDHLIDNYGNAEIVTYQNADDAAAAMYAGQVEALFSDYPQWEQDFMLTGDYKVVGRPQQLGSGVAMAFRPGESDLRRFFDSGLEQLKADGTYTRIRKNYLFFDVMM